MFRVVGANNARFFLFFTMVLISTLLLPALNNSKDFLLFTTWNMFSFNSQKKSVDITWDNGKSFLFRDHRVRASQQGINMHALFYLLNSNKQDKIRTSYLEKLRRYCLCEKIDIYFLQSDFFEHFILNKEPVALKKFML